ncbi:MAG: hypothetical protein ACRDAO_07590 [Culicoidibacterales bacterium]
MQIEYNSGGANKSTLGCWLWAILIIMLIFGGISLFFNIIFSLPPFIIVLIIAYIVYSRYQKQKRRQMQQEQFEQQFGQFYEQQDTAKRAQQQSESVIDADYRVVDDSDIQSKE